MPHCSVEGRFTSIRSTVVRFLSKPRTDSLSSLAAPMSHVGSGLPAPGTTDGERRSRVRRAHRPAHGDSRFVVPRRARRSVSASSTGSTGAASVTGMSRFRRTSDGGGEDEAADLRRVARPRVRGRADGSSRCCRSPSTTRPSPNKAEGRTRGAHDRNVAGRPGGAPGGAPRASGRKQRGPLREERAACVLPGDPRGT
jgi:hypothetical protein